MNLGDPKKYPLIGVTMGDPAGVGPEIILKAVSESVVSSVCRPVVIGDPNVLKTAAKVLEWRGKIVSISDPSETDFISEKLYVLCPESLDEGSFVPGSPTVQGGRASAMFIEQAVSLALEGKLQGIATCPINKAMLNMAGYHYQGHTQMIAKLTGCTSYAMMLAGSKLRVSLVTIHVPLAEVPTLISRESVFSTISITYKALVQDFAFAKPSLAVAALNPHGGEGGLFGHEEMHFIRPAVRRAQSLGLSVHGPFPADTVFWRAVQGEFDAVVAMYHDQGLGPLKTIHFNDAVNVTLGLPIVRTSVDHGTAYDLAGTGKANHASLVSALNMAAMIARNRQMQEDTTTE